MLIQVSGTEAGILVKALLAVTDQLILTGSPDAAESLREITGKIQGQITMQTKIGVNAEYARAIDVNSVYPASMLERRAECRCYKWDEDCPNHPNHKPEGR